MGKIREIVLFSDYFMIDRSVLKSKGIFDPAINLDTTFYRSSFIKEFKA